MDNLVIEGQVPTWERWPFSIKLETFHVVHLFKYKQNSNDKKRSEVCGAIITYKGIKWNSMRREQIEQWIAEGYNVLEHKKPKVIQGDIWEYLNNHDGHGTDVYALSELAKCADHELHQLELQKYAKEYGQLGEKQFLRNESIRTKSFDKYAAFLRLFYPNSVEKEVEEAKFLAERVRQVNKEEMEQWVTANHINVLLSDLNCLDQDAILTGMVIPSEEVVSYTDGGLQDTMDCHLTPMEFFSHTDFDTYWIDPKIKA